MTTTKVQNGEIMYADLFLDKLQADALFEDFISSLPFHQGTIKLFGKTHSIPRLEAFLQVKNVFIPILGLTCKPMILQKNYLY